MNEATPRNDRTQEDAMTQFATIDDRLDFFYPDAPRMETPLPKTAIQILGHDRYQWTHGHKPKGFGGWGFDLHGSHFNLESVEFWFTGNFGDAKKAAVEAARRLGYYDITILT
jgi:hypothetical protein